MPVISVPHTFIIAEAGVNHNGSLEMARRLVEVAAKAGADAIKFQTFRAQKLTSKTAPKAAYQIQTDGSNESQQAMLARLELGEQAHRVLIEDCRKLGILFLSTPFDLESLVLLAESLDLPRLKLSSGEITNGLLLLRSAQYGKPVILSTGMSTLGEVEAALGVLAFGYLSSKGQPSAAAFGQAYQSDEGQKQLQEKVTLLHCTTEYPAPFAEVNLEAMDTLKSAFRLPVGLSDHTPGIAIPIAAVARGAAMVEKHFTLDKGLPGPDHQASLEPEELRTMVRSIREVEAALGNYLKVPTTSELKNVSIVRKSLVANCQIKQGELFTEENLTMKRPGTGLSPMWYWEILGKKADRDYQPDEPVMAP
ncbi:MAG TPA: N-acetylneuraminate synthase [Bacillota bacterium]|nr:N-acetylneuraminate synthase [Bacillota bacterium]